MKESLSLVRVWNQSLNSSKLTLAYLVFSLIVIQVRLLLTSDSSPPREQWGFGGAELAEFSMESIRVDGKLVAMSLYGTCYSSVNLLWLPSRGFAILAIFVSDKSLERKGTNLSCNFVHLWTNRWPLGKICENGKPASWELQEVDKKDVLYIRYTFDEFPSDSKSSFCRKTRRVLRRRSACFFERKSCLPICTKSVSNCIPVLTTPLPFLPSLHSSHPTVATNLGGRGDLARSETKGGQAGPHGSARCCSGFSFSERPPFFRGGDRSYRRPSGGDGAWRARSRNGPSIRVE